MRIAIVFADRVGIAHEVLAVLARRRLNVVAVEVEPPHMYVDAPELDPASLAPLRADLTGVPGVRDAVAIDLLPGARRRLHLDAVLAALADPVLAVDAQGAIVLANPAAAAAAVGSGGGGADPADLRGTCVGTLFGDAALRAELIATGFRAPAREVVLGGRPYLLDVRPIAESAAGGPARAAGGVVILNAPSRLGERLHALRNFDEGGFERILGDSPPIRELKARAARVAAVDAPLLILGETGTGKELIAHACHRASARAERPFLALNCAALPENLAESELFGYAPGAFTGARRGGKPGLLELADRGSVFLDEIGEMSPYLQAKLLRFLNDGSFRRVGAEAEQRVDVRIISATHRNLDQMVAERAFREDLFYRLNVLTLRVPPLRARGDDILLLARHFIDRACAQTRGPTRRLTAGASAALLANAWSGNVRQLENMIFRAVTMSDGPDLDVADLEIATSRMAAGEPGALADRWEDAVAEFEKALLNRLFPAYPSSRKLAARLKTSHTMIANKLRKYGIARG
ncbi:sigma 54-interacting transcriptional regulator [Azospirillum halopraeferens]|uniref:sigma 54-interacting transcriptional regulator n=1 Tax=Azospirillum halopraeferens TaxID=34010 RepID=UPI0004069004|nr:sigma 54-interacting transcriptional regulator [Azospirillum halopraeferens]